MNIIATDTSSQALTVAIKTDSYYQAYTSESRSLQHSERLMPTVNQLCKDAGITTKDLDLLVCTRGPGSFTGLRIGMAAFKGMAFGLDKPLVSISTLQVLASCVPCFDGAIVSAMDAKKQRWYLAAFEKKSGTEQKLERLTQDIDGTEADLVEVLKPYDKVLVTGPDSEAFAQILRNLFVEDSVYGYKEITADTVCGGNLAKVLISCGLEKLEKDGPDDIGQGPVYLRKSDAEIALEERQREKTNG